MNEKIQMIVEMLQNWYFIDSVLLNDHAKYAITEKKDYDEYVALKTSILNNLREFYSYIGYQPANLIPRNHKQIQESARLKAIESKSISARMLEHKDMLNHMKKVIKEHFNNTADKDLSSVTDKVVNERFIKMSLDNILVGKPILQCEHKDKVSDFKAEILEHSYLTLRSEMLKIAKKYNKSIVNESFANVVKVGAGIAAGSFILSAAWRSIQAGLDRCVNRCGMLRIHTHSKQACILKCKIDTQRQIISSLKQSASQVRSDRARSKFARDVQRAEMKMAQLQRQLATLTAKHPRSDELEASDSAKLF